LARMLSVFERYPEAGLVGPVSNYVSGHQLVNGGHVSYQNLAQMPQFAANWTREHVGQTMETNRIVGFCLLARREIINQIGGLDEQFGRGNFEDDDFCIRAALAGFKVRIALDAFIHHTGNQTFKGAGIDYYQSMLDNWELFKSKWNIPLDTPLDEPFEFPSQQWDAAKHFIPLPSGTTTPKQIVEEPAYSKKETRLVNGSTKLVQTVNLDDLLTQVKTAQGEGNWPQAITLLRATLDQSRLAEDVSLLNSLGYCYVMNDQLIEAEATFQKGLRFDPDHLDLLSNLADLYLHQEQYDQATAYLNRALQINPDDVNVLLSLGTCCIQLSVFDAALMAFQRVQVLAPETEGINEMLDELETIALAAI